MTTRRLAPWPAVMPALFLFLSIASLQLTKGQFVCTTNNGAITITEYTGTASELTIPSSIGPNPVVAIGPSAFFSALELVRVTIPESVTNIGVRAFGSCSNLADLIVDPANGFFSAPGGVLFDKQETSLLQYPSARAGAYNIPNTVTNIAIEAFGSARNLTQVTLPDSLKNIGSGAFGNCVSLPGIVIPPGIQSIEDGTFSNCSSLTNISIPDSVNSIGRYAFTFSGLTTLTLPPRVQTIGDGAFGYSGELRRVVLPSALTNIGSYAFIYCTNLMDIHFLGNAPALGTDSFRFVNAALTFYRLSSATGFGTSLAGFPVFVENLRIVTDDGKLGRNAEGRFGFTVAGSDGLPVLIEVGKSPGLSDWMPVTTNTISGGSFYFLDTFNAPSASGIYRARTL